MAGSDLKPYTGPLDALKRIPAEQGGVQAFWRGHLTNVSRVVPTYALRFALFDVYRRITTYGLDPDQVPSCAHRSP